MWLRRIARRSAVAALLVLCAAPPLRAADEVETPSPAWPVRLRASLGYDYSTGKYGTSERTDIGYIPLRLRAEVGEWLVALTIPYIRIDGASAPVIEGGAGPVETVDADGLGDINLFASYRLAPLRDWLPWVELGGRVKFPTADASEGLGTGRFDYTLQVELSRVFGPVTPFVSVGYRFLGEPRDFHLHDVWLASAGGVYALSDTFDTGLFLYFRQASSSATEAQLELLPFVGWQITPHWATNAYVSAGLLDGSPDVGVGLQITYSYTTEWL